MTKSSDVVILPYKTGSNSAKALADALTQRLGKRVRLLYNDERSKFVPKAKHKVIVWGSSKSPFDINAVGCLLNSPDKIEIASNKLETFKLLQTNQNVSIPEFTGNRQTAEEWIEQGSVVVARTKLSAHSGAGIVVCSRVDDLPDCPLYTKYVKKRKEFRVHVVSGEVIDVQQKKKRSDFDGAVNYAIRNHQNGWIYAREDLEIPEDLNRNAIEAVATLGLDFGAVDIVWNEHHNRSYVLEVNTAPGLEGTSVQNYADVFTRVAV